MSDEATSAGKSTRWHQDHDALAHELRSWFTNSSPEIAYEVTQHWYGFLSNPEGPIGPRLTLNIDDPSRVAAALLEAGSSCGGQVLTVWVDDRERWAQLDGTLQVAGCRPVKATTHLALVGSLKLQPGPLNLHIEDVDDEHLEEWAITKIKCFDDREEQPSRERITAEMSTRRAEMALAKLQLARLDAQPVGVVAFFAGSDQLVFNLGTRVPFRHRGIAQQMLARWVEEGVKRNCRSLIINADDPGKPQELYRKMGFVDEIYWYQRYEFDTVDS
jgi:GNAT superfamily N-acetyltransferase